MKRPGPILKDHNDNPSIKKKKARISSAPCPRSSKDSLAQKSINKTTYNNGDKSFPKQSKRKASLVETNPKSDTNQLTSPALTLSKLPAKIQAPDSITIVFGTYEHILYGLRLSFHPHPLPPTFSVLFHFLAHPSPINVLAVPPYPVNPTLISSTTDSPLTLWSLTKRRCIGTLSCGVLAPDAGGAGREPGVRIARFDSSGKILVVGDETGGMSIYRSRDWALVRKLAGSGKGRVNDLAIEPRKGRLMLSVGQDRCLRMWDLGGGKGKGKPMASVRLGAEGDRVGWSPSGKKIVVITGTITTVYDTMMMPLFTFTSPRGRVHDAKFYIDTLSEEYLVLACDDAICRIFHLGNSTVNSSIEPKCVAELVAHFNRVKAVELVSLNEEQGFTYAITISSDGFSHVYRLESKTWSNEAPIEIEPIAKYDTGGCRLTCLAAAAVVNQSDRDLKEPSASNAQCTSEDEESGIDLDASGQPLNLESSDHTDSEQNE
ncbi:hypothetical protein O181_001307 [Austropuccinia psidii MF-1]|uniref:Uncharacterized protein n=1 Tax=Austropuccinia psidii MF-1 TaxID=1389203 RepID=A0A9Q3GCW8_9BASI|nr:hypothetical protein [Austropuccinia psidii MF-1]